jgi:hypothetical protein
MKIKLGGMNVLYPTPTVLVGAIVDGKPNFLTIAHIGIVNHAHISRIEEVIFHRFCIFPHGILLCFKL